MAAAESEGGVRREMQYDDGAGRRLVTEATRTLRLALAAGLLLLACVLGVALSRGGGVSGVTTLEEAQATALTTQQVHTRCCPCDIGSCLLMPPHLLATGSDLCSATV